MPANRGSTTQSRRNSSNVRRAGSASTVEDLYSRYFSSNGVAAGGSPSVSLPGIRGHRRHIRPGREAEAAVEADAAAADVAARAANTEAGAAAQSGDGGRGGETRRGGDAADPRDPTAQHTSDPTTTTTTSTSTSTTATATASSSNNRAMPVLRSGGPSGSATRRLSLQRLAETSDADHHADIDGEIEKLSAENRVLKASNAKKDAVIAAQAKELAQLRSALAAAALEAPSLEASRPTTAVNAVREEDEEVSAAAVSVDGTDAEHHAATKIQATYRGHRARNPAAAAANVALSQESDGHQS